MSSEKKLKILVGNVKNKVPIDILRAAAGLDILREIPEVKEWIDAPLTEEEKESAFENEPKRPDSVDHNRAKHESGVRGILLNEE